VVGGGGRTRADIDEQRKSGTFAAMKPTRNGPKGGEENVGPKLAYRLQTHQKKSPLKDPNKKPGKIHQRGGREKKNAKEGRVVSAF